MGSGAPPPKPKRGGGRGGSPQPGDYGYNDATRALVSLFGVWMGGERGDVYVCVMGEAMPMD